MLQRGSMSARNEHPRFASVDLATLDAACGGAALVERIQGLDAQGTGFYAIDNYDNGAFTDWDDASHGVTHLPSGYGGWLEF